MEITPYLLCKPRFCLKRVIDKLNESSVLLVQDWEMKYLPRKYQESQADWFGKCGILWHVTVATRREDSCAVLAVMADIIRQLKTTIPQLECMYYRQDNVGCYRWGATVVCTRVICQQFGVTIKRLDFSDPLEAATIKSHMRINLNSGHDIETPAQMKDAILASSEVSAVNASLMKQLMLLICHL